MTDHKQSIEREAEEAILQNGTKEYCSLLHCVEQYKLGNCPLSDVEASARSAMIAYAGASRSHGEKELQQLFEEQKAFSSKTFGDRSFTGPLHHLLKEIKEVLDVEEGEHGMALTEFADCFLLLLDAYWRRFPYWQSEQLLSAAFNKLEVNKKRKWGAPDANGASQHIPESDPPSEIKGEQQ